ncbi:MAG: cupin domain-containing protein [Blastocatellia bacterium]|nr:cupin domain-containing protein [Blastocatellia bacterium]
MREGSGGAGEQGSRGAEEREGYRGSEARTRSPLHPCIESITHYSSRLDAGKIYLEAIMGFYDWDQMNPEEITELYRRKLAIGENVTVARVEVMEGAVTQTHSHESEEIVIVLKGAWRFYLPTGEVVLRPNQMLSIPPGVEHSSEALEDTVALDICTPARIDWLTGEDRFLHRDPDEVLWAV